MSRAERIVEAILNDLRSRKGFDDWWDDIDEDIQIEMRTDLAALVDRESGG